MRGESPSAALSLGLVASCLAWALAACMPADITYRSDDATASGPTSSGGSGGTSGGGAAGAGQGGAAGGNGHGGQCAPIGAGGEGGTTDGEPCLGCWDYALAGAKGTPCACPLPIYEAYVDCVCDACSAECVSCGGLGSSAECGACYQAATGRVCSAQHGACVGDTSR